MKNKTLGLALFIAAIGIASLSMTACDNGTTSNGGHTHDWGEWTETTPATYLAEGEETRTCKTDPSHKETRVSPQKSFTDIAALGTFLSTLTANTADTPYTIKLNVDDISTLKTVLNDNEDKYVYLDLSGSTITAIPNNAFNTGNPSWTGCATLAGITIPNSVTSIGGSAFNYCNSLASVTIPDSVTSIGEFTFGTCTSLTSITIPNSVTSIGGSAFYFCTSLTSVTIPNSVTTIGEVAFQNCTSLTSITIPNSVTSIGNSAFYKCTSLTSIIIGANKNYAGEFDNNFKPFYESQGKKAGTYTWSGRLWSVK